MELMPSLLLAASPIWETMMVPQEVIDPSIRWGNRAVLGWASGEKPVSSTRVASEGADRDVRLQAMSRIGECMFCVFLGFSLELILDGAAALVPGRLLDWGSKPDQGWDLIYRRRKWDVKTSNMQRLLWPWPQNDRLIPPRCDILVGVWGANWYHHNWSEVTLLGWMPIWSFIHRHKIGTRAQGMTPGTKYMDGGKLYNISLVKA